MGTQHTDRIQWMSRCEILRRAPASITGHVLGLACILGFSELLSSGLWTVIPVSALLLTICAARVFLLRYPVEKVAVHFPAYAGLILGAALCWSSLLILAFHGSENYSQSWLISGFVLASIPAAGLAGLAPERTLVRLFTALILFPPAVYLMLFQDLIVVGIMMITYLAVLIRQAEVHCLSAHEHYRALIEIEEQQRELELHRAQAIQNAKMSSLGEMSGAVAHEINNPLTIIYGLASQIQRQIKSESLDSTQILKSTSKISATVDRISRIVKGLRSFARDGSEDPFEEIGPQEIIDETMALCQERFLSKGIKLEIQNHSKDSIIQARSVQLSQVLLNLLNNSYHAVKDQEKSWIRLEVRDFEGMLRFEVTDSGEGIPPETAARIMEPFFTTKSIGEGTGLGLSISTGISRDHGGRLYYDDSHPNTRFVLEIPLSPAAASETA